MRGADGGPTELGGLVLGDEALGVEPPRLTGGGGGMVGRKARRAIAY
jgi:hypothetical protein